MRFTVLASDVMGKLLFTVPYSVLCVHNKSAVLLFKAVDAAHSADKQCDRLVCCCCLRVLEIVCAGDCLCVCVCALM